MIGWQVTGSAPPRQANKWLNGKAEGYGEPSFQFLGEPFIHSVRAGSKNQMLQWLQYLFRNSDLIRLFKGTNHLIKHQRLRRRDSKERLANRSSFPNHDWHLPTSLMRATILSCGRFTPYGSCGITGDSEIGGSEDDYGSSRKRIDPSQDGLSALKRCLLMMHDPAIVGCGFLSLNDIYQR